MQLDKASLRRVVDQTRQAERNPRATPPPPRGPILSFPLKYAVVSTAIKPATSAGPGKGMIRLRTVTYDSAGNAFYGTPDPPVAAYSCDLTGSAVGALVVVAVIDGQWNVIVEICAATTATPTPTTPTSTANFTAPAFAATGFDAEGF